MEIFVSRDLVKVHPLATDRTGGFSFQPFVDAGEMESMPAFGLDLWVLLGVFFEAGGTALLQFLFLNGRIEEKRRRDDLLETLLERDPFFCLLLFRWLPSSRGLSLHPNLSRGSNASGIVLARHPSRRSFPSWNRLVRVLFFITTQRSAFFCTFRLVRTFLIPTQAPRL